jgi:hypothetical protein
MEGETTVPAEPRRTGLGALLASHRRGLIILGAIVMLVTYFFKDVVNEETKERTSMMRAGGTAYLASMPSLQEQLNEMANTSELLNGDASTVSREKALISMGNLSLRAQRNSLQLSALFRSMGDAAESKKQEVRGILDQTTHTTDAASDFLKMPPSDSMAFQSGAKLLIQKFQALEDEVGKTGTELYSLDRETSETLERKSSRYGYTITALYLLGLVLTVICGLYEIEIPTAG